MIEVKNLEQTCDACPSQWEFRTFENRPVYVRYRWGNLTVSVGPSNGDVYDAVGGIDIVAESLGDPMDGFIEWAQVEEYLYKLNQDELKDLLNDMESRRA